MARTKTLPRGLGNPNRPGQPHAMTPAARATDTATSTGPANALMVTRPARARTAIVTRGCSGISGTGSTAASAAAAARFCARVNVGALGFADLSGFAEGSDLADLSGLAEGSDLSGESGLADEFSVADDLDCAADSGAAKGSGVPYFACRSILRLCARVIANGSGVASVTCGILPSPAGKRGKHLEDGPFGQWLGGGHRTPVEQDRRHVKDDRDCLLYTSPSPRDGLLSR